MRARYRRLAGRSAGAVVLMLALAGNVLSPVAAARAEAQIGVYFDSEATQIWMLCHQCPARMVTFYVIATGAAQTIGGVAFALDIDPQLVVLRAEYPSGVQIGDLEDGIQIGFTRCAYGEANVLIATVTAWQFAGAVGGICVAPYPPAGVVQLADCEGNLRAVAGGCAYLVDPIPVDVQTWGAVKGLYTE